MSVKTAQDKVFQREQKVGWLRQQWQMVVNVIDVQDMDILQEERLQIKNDPHSCECNLCNCINRP